MSDAQPPDEADKSNLPHCSADVATKSPTAQPGAIVDPIDWRGLDPKLAAALVLASCSVETVPKDAKSGEGYKYATTAAVVEYARRAMTIAKIAMPLVKYKVSNGWMHGVFILIHESGSASPDIHASIPLSNLRDPTKSIGATLSYLRKYTAAALIGIGWDNPEEDVDAGLQKNQNKKHHKKKHQPSQPTQQQPQNQHQPKPKSEPHPNGAYESLLVNVRAILKGSRIDHDDFWKIATGLDGMPKVSNPTPQSLPPHQLRAVVQAERNIRVLEEANVSPDRWTHSSYIGACNNNSFGYAMDEGKATSHGELEDMRIADWRPGADPEGESK